MSGQKSGSHWVERIGCGAAGLVALLALSFGLLSVLDAALSRGSGEWGSFAQVVDVFLDVPAGLAVFALAFTQRRGLRRTAFIVLAGVILLIPVASWTVRRTRAEAYRRELEKSMQRRERPVAPPTTAPK